jgi:general secretion pathway protein K
MSLKHRHSQGVALIAVLWLVAAMGLIVSGIVHSVRSELRTAGQQRQSLVAGAQADAAILLALQHLAAQPTPPGAALQTLQVQFEGQTLRVTAQPLNGLIDINNASPLLLADLYQYAGGLTPEAAQALALATETTRKMKSEGGPPQGFDAIEDLFRVPAMTYNVYAKLKNHITAVVKEGSGRVNPMASPLGVLQVLAGGNESRAVALAARREQDPTTMDTSFLKPDQIQMEASRSLRLEVPVPLPDGSVSLKSWDIYWGKDPRSGLPWRMLNTQQTLQPASQATN